MRTTILSFCLVASAGCVPGTSPIRIVNIFPINTGSGGTECKLDSTITQGRGRLDASGGGDYVVVLGVVSELDDSTQIVSNRGVALTGPQKRNFVVDTVGLTYKSNPVIQFEAEQLQQYFEVLPGSDDNRMSVDIIGDKAADRLRTMVTDTTTTTQLTVTIQLKGHLASGESVSSNPINFPIEVFTSDANCPEPGNVAHTGPCGVRGGQDTTVVTCCPAGTGAGGC